MNIRLAKEKDIDQLIKMRWDFTLEHDVTNKIVETSYEKFEQECMFFLKEAVSGNKWFIWVAEEAGVIASHIYIELIQKVPRPGRVTYPFAYMTNVYTNPEFRNKGIGSKLLSKIHEWVKENHYEFIIVWPSEDSINYYKKNGYAHCAEPMEFIPE